jgi:hypothetical protein
MYARRRLEVTFMLHDQRAAPTLRRVVSQTYPPGDLRSCVGYGVDIGDKKSQIVVRERRSTTST